LDISPYQLFEKNIYYQGNYMSNFITLSCPSCGSKLEVTNEMELFACGNCGNEHFVNRKGGVVSLKPVIESLGGIKVGVDKTASELAIVRLKEEIFKLELKRDKIEIKEVVYHKNNNNNGCMLGIFGLVILYFTFSPEPQIAILLIITALITIFYNSKKTQEQKDDFIRAQNIKNESAMNLKDKLSREIINKKRELKNHEEIVKFS
jgi:predicted RNA-binding Zn-ribbon protein involved in translation (DUF1610 family)